MTWTTAPPGGASRAFGLWVDRYSGWSSPKATMVAGTRRSPRSRQAAVAGAPSSHEGGVGEQRSCRCGAAGGDHDRRGPQGPCWRVHLEGAIRPGVEGCHPLALEHLRAARRRDGFQVVDEGLPASVEVDDSSEGELELGDSGIGGDELEVTGVGSDARQRRDHFRSPGAEAERGDPLGGTHFGHFGERGALALWKGRKQPSEADLVGETEHPRAEQRPGRGGKPSELARCLLISRRGSVGRRPAEVDTQPAEHVGSNSGAVEGVGSLVQDEPFPRIASRPAPRRAHVAEHDRRSTSRRHCRRHKAGEPCSYDYHLDIAPLAHGAPPRTRLDKLTPTPAML